MRSPESPLFLLCRSNIDFNLEPCWYYDRPAGKNTIGKYLSEAGKILSTSSKENTKKVSNHSARKTCLTTLLNNNVEPIHVSN